MGKTSLHSAKTVAETPSLFFYESDFSSDNWTDEGSGIGVNTTSEKLEGNYVRNSTNDASWIDMAGENISDTEWVMRLTYDITEFEGTDYSGTFAIFGISDVTGATGAVGSRDGLCFSITRETGWNKTRLCDPNSDAWFEDIVAFLDTDASVTTWYLELKRISSTSFTSNIYSDSTFETLIESKNATINANVISLRYLVAQDYDAGASTNSVIIDISNIKVKNGTSTY